MSQLQQVLEEQWELTHVAEMTYQFTYITEPGIPMACLTWINPHREEFFFRVVLTLSVDEPVRPQMAELITRINYPLPDGAFALDYETGDLRFKSSLFFGKTPLQPATLRHIIDSSLAIVDQHILSIVHVLMGASVQEALRSREEVHQIASTQDQRSFEEFIQGYLRSLFIKVGVDDITRVEIQEFQEYLDTSMGNQYIFGGYNGVPRQHLNDQDMRAAYEKGTLRFSASRQGMAVIQTYKERLLHGRRTTNEHL
jgi:hypothetical protein